MREPVVVWGAGGFGREAIEVILAENCAGTIPRWQLLGVVDDDPSPLNLARLTDLGVAYLGDPELLRQIENVSVVLGVGSPSCRGHMSALLDQWGISSPTIVHPSAVISRQSTIGQGAVICAGVSVGTNVAIGCHVHLNAHVVIGHDTVLKNHVSVNPNATISGDCTIGEGALIGAAAVVLEQVAVGDDAVVGAAACVVRDVPTGRTVKGVPAR